jgi:glucose/arabinose dehydrogenase
MDLQLHPQFASNGLLYLAFGHVDGDVRVVRYRFVARPPGQMGPGVPPETLAEDRVIIAGVPAAVNHAGCRMAFGPDAKLYITTGEAFRKELAQDPLSLGGKTLRLNDDGTVPTDNPFVGVAGVRPEIWSLGHRNAQGIAFQPGTGVMFQTEHGPSTSDAPPGGDELNIVERGKNYGWPVIHHRMRAAGLETPHAEWTPAIAPASGVFYEGDAFPALRGDFLFGALRGEAVWRVALGQDRRTIVLEKRFVTGFGRIRDVVAGPDGLVYFSTSNRDGRGRVHEGDDHILRLVPVVE